MSNSNGDAGIFDKIDSPQSIKLPHVLRSGGAPPRSTHSAALTKARKANKLEAKHGHQIDTTLDTISDFNSTSLNKFNPEYSECEQQFVSTIQNFKSEVDKLQEMQDLAVEMVKQFTGRVEGTEVNLDNDIVELRKWQPPREKLQKMQARVNELKEVMSRSRQKLFDLDDSVTLYEKENEKRQKNIEYPLFICGSIVLLVLALALAYFFH